MHGTPSSVTTDSVDLADARRGRSRWVIGAGVLVLFTAAAVAAHGGLFDRGARNAASSGVRSATTVATVTRQTLKQTTQFNGVLGYAGSYSILGRKQGTVTWLPPPTVALSWTARRSSFCTERRRLTARWRPPP